MVIERYLAKEVLQTLLAVLLVLLLIFLGRFFAMYLGDAIAGRISAGIVMDLLLLQTIAALSMMFPFALYVAVILAFGRLYKDSEMVAMAACGIDLGRVLRTVLAIGSVVGLLVAGFSLWSTPWAHEQSTQVREQAATANPFTAVSEGRFNRIGSSDRVFYVARLSDDHSELREVFVSDSRDGRLTVYSASSGYRYRDPGSGVQYLVLVDGQRYEGTPGKADFKISRFAKNAVRLDESERETLERRLWAIPSSRLWNSSLPQEVAELQWRLSMPLAAVLLAVLGALLSRASPRQGRYGKLFIALLAFVLYYNTLGVAKNWVERGLVPPELGLWWVHVMLLLVLGWLGTRQYGWLWLRDRLSGRVSLRTVGNRP